MTRPLLRCAIYTRKSSEEGLDQSFNSLQAQREACEAYIKSQAHEGWRLIETAYDDGGFSGGSLDRPSLQRLLLDIQHRKIDVVVVYKVDRLTRSLADFAKIVEILDGHGASFVSVTQHFNTTSSMGRLTLNVLLSFAQFEREVTGERIRDKFAASRRKGMWMGGHPPLGYDIRNRKLVVNEREAEHVRAIYTRYLVLGSVTGLMADLCQRGIHSKRWTTQADVTRGGQQFGRGALYALLQNRLYLGEAVHKGTAYPGEHEAIVPRPLWDQVRAKLKSIRHERAPGSRSRSTHLLTGLLFDDRGNPMTPSHTRKRNGTRYRYYISQALLQQRPSEAGTLPRVSAGAIEDLVRDQALAQMRDEDRKDWPTLEPSVQAERLRDLIRRVEIGLDAVVLTLTTDRTTNQRPGKRDKRSERVVRIPIRLTSRGGERLIVSANGEDAGSPRLDKSLVKAVARAWSWRESLVRGQAHTIADIATRTGLTERYVREVMPLAFLAPDIITEILAGCQPRHLTLAGLHAAALPLTWSAQCTRLHLA